jgi:terminal uridylyltransferase
MVKKLGPLDFPKVGVGIQCDINFENPLAIHNTQLLRCYSLTDPRVRPIVLFIKAWAKRRKINSAYSGTLSSYGWVLMVLHYLVNIANPPVCPNLQSSWRPATTKAEDLQQILQETLVGGYAVRFWHDEAAIVHLASSSQLNRNTQSIGELLCGFFHYYASIAQPSTYGQRPWCFYWATEVLSLRTPGGIRQKTEKGWTRAMTTISNGKEVRQRYLFAIEDPFELDHNVARTVTHEGIVAIRDELRRAGRILGAVGRGQAPEGGLFDEVVEQAPPVTPNKTEAESETVVPVADEAVSRIGGVEPAALASVASVPVPAVSTAEPSTGT